MTEKTRRQYLRGLSASVGGAALPSLSRRGVAQTVVEGFENNSLERWSNVESADTTTTVSYAGDRSLMITDQYGPDSDKMGNKIRADFTPFAPSQLTAALRIDNGTYNSVITSWGNGETALTARLDNGSWAGGTEGIHINGNRVGDVVSGTWYYIELSEIQWETNTVGQVQINGKQVVESLELDSIPSETSSTTLFVHDAGTGSQGYFDEITVGTQSSSEQTTASPATESVDRQAAESKSQTPSNDEEGSIPVLNRFGENGESLGLGAGVLGLLGGSGYLAYRRSDGDDNLQGDELYE